MTKLLLLALLFAWTPGFVLWVTLAGLAAAGFALAEELSGWRAEARRVPVRLRVDRRR